MEFTRAAQVVAGILFHSSIMTELLDVRHMVLLHLRLRMPHMCSIGLGLETYLATPSPSPSPSASAARQLSSWWCVWGGYVGKQFLKGGHLLLQNFTVHVGVHVSLNEPQLPSTSSTHAAPDHDATTTMLTVGKAQFFLVLLTRASPHMLDTIWVKQVFLRLIRPQDMVPVIHCSWPGCLQQTVCRLFCEPASEEASFWDDSHANRLVAVCGVWSEHWQADLPLLQPLKQCWQHSCVCFLKPASESWRTAQGLNFFDRPLRGLFWVKPVLENPCMTLATFVASIFGNNDSKSLLLYKLHIDYSKIYPSFIL